MSKLAALIAALLVAAHAAAALRTITTTVVSDEAEFGPMGRTSMECQEEVQRMDLSPCMQYLGQQVMPEEMPGGPMMKDMCCDRLNSSHRKDCVCDGLQLWTAQFAMARPDIMGRMMQAARNLPGMCNITPSTCKFSMVQY